MSLNDFLDWNFGIDGDRELRSKLADGADEPGDAYLKRLQNDATPRVRELLP